MSVQKVNNNNKILYFIVVSILGIICLSSLITIFVLSFYDKAVPESLIVLGSVSVGALSSVVSAQPNGS
jgi:hypothetical protein